MKEFNTTVQPRTAWLGCWLIGLLSLIAARPTVGQTTTANECEAAILAGDWKLLATNRTDGAVAAFCRAVAIGVISEGQMMEREGQHGLANGAGVDDFCKGIRGRNPRNANVRFVCATASYDKEAIIPALDEYQRVTELSPHFALAFYQMAALNKLRANRVEQLKWIDKCIRSNTNSVIGYFAKGNMLRDDNEINAAVEQFQKAVDILTTNGVTAGPQLGYAYLNWGTTLASRPKSDNDQVIAILTKAFKADPLAIEAYREIGNAFKRKERYGEAIRFYKMGIEKGDKTAAIYVNLGIAEEKRGHIQEAVDAFVEANSRDPVGPMGAFAAKWLEQMSRQGVSVAPLHH